MGLKTKMTAFALTACMVLTVLPSAASAEAAAAGKVTRINVQGERSAAYLVIRQELSGDPSGICREKSGGKIGIQRGGTDRRSVGRHAGKRI